MSRGAPYGYADEVIDSNGWAAWDPEKGCPTCGAKTDEDGEPLYALQCPTCEEPGCDECVPGGRGCECSQCGNGGFDPDW